MQILIVDDEILAINRIERILKELNEDNIFKETSTEKAFEIIKQENIEIIFLDINMPENGLKFAEKVHEYNSDIFVIFQTAYENFALDAYKVGGIDYILKPASREDIQNALSKVKKFAKKEEPKFLTKSYDESFLIKASDIIYIKANLTEVIIRTSQHESYLQRKISILETELKDFGFFRVHRSYLVNLDKIKSLITVEQSRFKIEFHEIDEVISTSRDGAKFLREYLKK
jgi:two-component system LytT family response regulator